MSEIGYKDDNIFLLSAEEYEYYKDKIPHINLWWWLRSPGNSKYNVAYVYSDSYVNYDGSRFYHDGGCVRPAVRYRYKPFDQKNVGDKVCECGYTWVVIDKENDIAIAEMPIGIGVFDYCSHYYNTSHVRKRLLDWYKERTAYFGEDE